MIYASEIKEAPRYIQSRRPDSGTRLAKEGYNQWFQIVYFRSDSRVEIRCDFSKSEGRVKTWWFETKNKIGQGGLQSNENKVRPP